jgi:hypothetical protein
MALEATVVLNAGSRRRQVSLAAYLDAEAEEAAARDANRWIKSLRHARVDGAGFRERFTYRGDSLWWFAELYLHKEQAVVALMRAIRAATALFDREHPAGVRLEAGDRAAALALAGIAGLRGVPYDGPRHAGFTAARLVRMDARSTTLMFGALGSPGRPFAARRPGAVAVASFVHRAFWRGGTDDEAAESYIGPVLQAIARRLPGGALAHVGIGPPTNFRERRSWRRGGGPRLVEPIERFVPHTALAGASGLWAARHAMRRALWASRDLREAACIAGCDCWPVIADALAGVALLQFPWSARAMDEAGAALDALQPAVALTYAEAGGWGRALALEARRRGIPLAGLQHGFIYRHWLNYLHEADEMQPAAPGSPDVGFPLPAATLVFDSYAARHLVEAGRFPPGSVVVTGSPRLDALAAAFAGLTPDATAAARAAAGAEGGRPLVLLVSKFSEVRYLLPPLLDAIAALPETVLAIKTHPAEAPASYERAAAGRARVRVLPAAAPLAPLLGAARALVTVNSTVALDALSLGVPALAIGLPNNLSPFVDAGAIAGAPSPAGIAPALGAVLYDEQFRRTLAAGAAATVNRYGMRADGRAAERSADAVMALARASADSKE